MAEVITQCDCGQLPALEPAEIPPAFIDYADDDGTRWNEPRAEYQARRAAECEACGAGPGEECRPMCIGQAAELDRLGVDLTDLDAHDSYPVPDCPSWPRCADAHDNDPEYARAVAAVRKSSAAPQ